MPRSSRHKSSKHSSRDYSDSEKDSILKERKPKEESGSHRVSREHASGEKRKYDSKVVDGKDVGGHGSVDFVQEYGGSSSKKRKEKVDDDRWTGGDADERELVKAEKDLKGLSDSKIRSRRGSSSGRAADVDEGKRSGSKGDSKHHKSERKERSEKEGGLERDRKGKEYSTNDRFVDGEVDIVGEGSRKKVVPLEDVADKHISSNSGAVSLDERRNHDHDRELERRSRRKDGSNDVDKYLDGKEVDDRRVSSRIETVKSVKYKDDGYEDRHKDKYGDDLEKDSRYQDEKQHHRDGRQARDYVSSRSAEKYVRDEKKDLDVQQKKSKPMDSDRDHSRSRHSRHHDDRDRDDRNRDIDLDRDGEHDGGRDLDRDRGRDLDHDRGRERDRDRGRDFDRDRDRERYRREHDRDRDYSSHLDERSSRYKEDRNRRRSPDDYDDYYTDKAKTSKADPHADREKSVSRRTHSEAVAGSTRGRTSPSYRSHMNVDKYRDNTHDDSKHGDSRQLLATPDKSSKYPSSDKNPKLDENYRAIDPSAERSPRKKTSPLKPLEKSPSTTSIDHKYANRSDRRRSLDVDEAERRSTGSNNVRDGSINDDRQSKDLSPKKSMGEEHSPVESSFHRKSSQVNGSFIGHGSSSYKAGADSPLIGSMGEDNRGHNNRYRRSVDPNPGRAHGNMWKGVPNWPTPMQSGFMPFPPGPHGPPHGVFPSVLPQFPSPPIFGIRPEMNHSGIPYHLPDADRFTNHMRPLGWQNMVDGTTPSHFPGWDANNGIYRDESSMYGPGCIPNGRVRETNADMWKQNGDVKSETGAKKDGNATENFTEANVTQTAQGSHIDNYQNEEQGIMKTPNGASINEALVDLTKVYDEKAPESPAVDDGPKILRAYLSSLDICVELTNPELYNEFVNLALVEQSDNFEDTEDADMGMPKDVVPEITNVTTDISLLPAAEDSIFQRALDLYKTHNVDRRSFCIFDGDVSNSPSASDMRVMDQGHGQEVTEKEMEEPIRYQEIQEQPVEEPVHYQEIQEQPVEEPVHYQEIKEQPVEEPASAAAQTEQMETEQVEQVETNTGDVSDDGVIDSPSCNVAVKEMASVENVSFKLSSGDVPISNTEDAEMGVAEDENENINVEQHGSEVSGPLSLPLDTVKVCEGLMPVSNDYESESVTITRVHDAPESTH